MPKNNNNDDSEDVGGGGLLSILTCRSCRVRKEEHEFGAVDDSVHVMLSQDKKRQKAKGQKPHGYVPRAPHPALNKDKIEVTDDAGGREGTNNTEVTNGTSTENNERNSDAAVAVVTTGDTDEGGGSVVDSGSAGGGQAEPTSSS